MAVSKMKAPYLAMVEFESPIPLESYPFDKGEVVLILGEIEQMPGHCAVVSKGVVHVGYHNGNFRKLTKDEA